MFDVVAPFAEGDEALQGLHVLLVVVVPDFVALHFACGTTDAAAVVVIGVDLFAQLVPLGTRKHLAHVAVPARFWNEFDGQAQVVGLLDIVHQI